jgi:murein DD-endopeptidase MepM/ murein hydrolase activator NlpD
MIFHTSKPTVLMVWVLLMMLTSCAQPPNYAPVKTVNQVIEPDSGYVRKKSPITTPSSHIIRPQESAKIIPKEQQNSPVRQNPIIKRLPYPSSYQNRASQNHSTDQTVKKEELPSSNTESTDRNIGLITPIPLPFQVEFRTKNKPANPVVNKFSVARQHNNPQQNAHQPENNSLTSKNNKEKTSIISIDNKKVLKLNFQWPIRGKISRNFAQTDNKGIDITGKTGQAVHAAEAGKAVYCGRGLAGIGNLVIIKHNETYLSAYAHNSKLYIKEGQQVEKGQTIGQVGSTGLKKTSLHFEIRKNGKPINPLTLMPKH